MTSALARAVILLGVAAGIPMGAADICSIRVLVENAEGKKVTMLVEARGHGGPTVRQQSKDGVADFCDLPFADYDIIVGPDGCGQTQVTSIPVSFMTERQVKVVANGCPHTMIPPFMLDGPAIRSMACGVLLRIHTKDGHPVAGAKVVGRSTLQRSDRYGRVWFGLADAEEVELAVTRDGYQRHNVGLSCAGEHRNTEKTIVLERLSR